MIARSRRAGRRRAISAETTFDADTADPEALEAVLERLCARVAERLRRRGLAGRTVTLKLKTHDFRARTRSATLAAATARGEVVAAAARRLLRREADGTRYRLLGVGVANLGAAGGADPPDMLDAAAAMVGDRGDRGADRQTGGAGQQAGGGGNSTSDSAARMAKPP